MADHRKLPFAQAPLWPRPLPRGRRVPAPTPQFGVLLTRHSETRHRVETDPEAIAAVALALAGLRDSALAVVPLGAGVYELVGVSEPDAVSAALEALSAPEDVTDHYASVRLSGDKAVLVARRILRGTDPGDPAGADGGARRTTWGGITVEIRPDADGFVLTMPADRTVDVLGALLRVSSLYGVKGIGIGRTPGRSIPPGA